MRDVATNKAVIYARVSSAQQVRKGDGLGSQQTRCREYAAARGYEIVQVFNDDASGKLIDRPGMKAMLKFLKSQKAPHVVIIDDISRLARNLSAHIELRAAIAACDGILESPSIEFGEDSDSQLIENLLASVSQHGREKNREQVKNRMRSRLQAGYWVFSSPIGYRYERVAGHGKMLVRDEPYATTVAEALEGFASGRFETQAEVMRFLQSDPAWSQAKRRAMTWDRIPELLRRSHYAGYLDKPEWDINLVLGKHEPLISYSTFKAVQDRLEGRTKIQVRANANEGFKLTGFVCCADCGNPYRAGFTKGRSKYYPYYFCATKSATATCPSYGKAVKRDVLEGEFEEILQGMEPTPSFFKLANDMLARLWEDRGGAVKKQVEHIKRELKRIESSIDQFLDRVIEAPSKSLVTAYENKIKNLEAERLSLQETAQNLSVPRGTFAGLHRTALEFLKSPYTVWVSGGSEARKLLLRLAFEERLAYQRGQGYRTAKTAIPFRFFSALAISRGLVDDTGIEPVTSPMSRERATAALIVHKVEVGDQ